MNPAENSDKPCPAIILAGGLGTRLRSVINDLPKPMAPVNGKPFLHYIFQYLVRQEIKEVVLAVGYKHESIRDFFGDDYAGISIQYSIELEPLGTGGGIKQAFRIVQDAAFVINGDTFFDVELHALKQFYIEKQADMALSLKQLQNFDRYGTVNINEQNRITEFAEKRLMTEGLINGGVYYMNKSLFDKIESPDKFSLEKDVLEKYVSTLKFYGIARSGYFIDIGIPGDYQKAQHDFA
jgi:D-glycero-alpha-D-manno-heptose 1-phosphate guanylyltransferase